MFEDLYYFGARFYDPDVCFVLVGCGPSANRFLQIGRFLTLDDYPLSLENLSPATFNHYSFARNDPINFIDFNGNVPWWHWCGLPSVGL